MDNMPPGLAEKSQNGGGISNGSSFRRASVRPVSTSSALDGSIPISPTSNFHTVVVVVHKDENGYGMNVSGDKPVYVQSVREGGAAEKAGLQCGDMIIKVNGVNVTQSTHTQVVSLIRASTDVELTVRQNCRNQLPRGSIVSMTSHLRPIHSHGSSVKATDRITAPQPVDEDKLRQFETQRVHTFRLMLEKEQLYVDALRFELAKCLDSQSESKIQQELNGATRRLNTLQEQLRNLVAQSEHSYTFSPNNSPVSSLQIRTILEGQSLDETPPPLPTRNRSFHSFSSPRVPTTGAGPPLPPRCNNLQVPSNNSAACLSNQSGGERGDDSVNSDAVSPHAASLGHHRTKSNPDPLGPPSQSHNMTPTEACRRLIASESLQDIYKRSKSHPGSCDVDSPHESPSGTPPPPYRGLVDDGGGEEDVQLRPHGDQTPDVSPLRGSVGPQSSTPVGQNIISMEDDDTSDQELSHLEDHGPFRSLKCLWQNHAHLAVFMNYVLSNSDPSSLLFYLVTDLYKEGNAKEMKKWAYEIHSSFLVPGAPLRLNNVDENFAREIDDVLLKESDKEEILRMIFWKARIRAREELNEQLADFQQKRTAGLGTLFGPCDASLDESINDKNKEMKIIESILIPKIESYMEDIEKDNVDIRRFTTAAALGTIMGKVFGLRGPQASSVLDRCPTFVSKDKSLKTKLLIGKSRKLSVRGHNFLAHHYYTVTYCNHCQLIIWGIGPQGYQCSNCNFNVHRHNCVKLVEESCPGPICKKERGDNRISKLMEKIRPEREARRKPSSLNFTQFSGDRNKKHSEERDDTLGVAENDLATGDRPVSGLRGVEKRPDTVRESEERPQNDDDANADNHLKGDSTHHNAKAKNSAININRSESYRERIPQKKIREKRKTSDPNLSKTNDVNLDTQGLSYNTNSGSSSNSSLSARSLDSPSAALDMVTATQQRAQEAITVTLAPSNIPPLLEDSDTEAEPDPPDWTRRVDENVLKSMTPREKKRQEVINELFHTEKTHVRKLKVLDQVFLKPMQDNQILPSDQLHLLFQNLEEMLDIHGRFNNAMKAKKKKDPLVGDIGDILLAMFDGPAGDNFQRAASVFCANQQIALEQLKERRKKDTKLNNFLTEAESNPLCRRLQLKDMLPTVMQRLTKYPLLFENLGKYSPKGSEEEKSVQQAVERSKDILNYVNQAVRAVEDHQRLAEIQKKLDKSAFEKVDHPMTNEFKNLDLRTHKLIYEGSLNWRIGNRQKLIDIHVLLLHDVIILLQKQDEKYVLKFYNVNAPSGGAPALSPIVKVSSVLVRDNAVDKTALYLVNTSHNLAQIYDLVASSPNERKIWFRHISEAADAYKHKDSFGRNRRVDPTVSIPHSPPDAGADDESPEKTKEPDESHDSDRTKDGNELDTSGTSQDGAESTQSNDSSQQQSGLSVPHPSLSSAASPESEHGRKSVDSSPSQRRKVEPVRLSTVQNSLIQPSQVVVVQNPVLTAEPVLTPLEQIRLKDEEIRKALLAKQQLVADVLHVPKEEFDTIAEMAGEPSVDKEATELVLAAVNQANQLAAAVNDALKVTEEEAVTVTSEVLPGHSPRGGRRKTRLPGVPALKLQGISNSLNSQLTQLLKIIKERDEEREMLRKELQRSREQIHVLHEAHRKSRKSPAHSRLAEDVTEESGDLTRDQGTESKNGAEETAAGSLHQGRENQDLGVDAGSEVFVDALSETLETRPETSEKEEDPPTQDDSLGLDCY